MRRVIALAIVFALAASAVFAQATVGGQLQIGTTFISGDSDDDDVYLGGMTAHEAKVRFGFGDGTTGGQFGLSTSGDWLFPSPIFSANASALSAWGFMFWRPSQLFRMQVGVNPDGDFGAPQITGWGFTAEAKNSVAAISDYAGGLYMAANREVAFYPGTSEMANVNLSLFPTSGVSINLVLPFGATQEASASLSRLHLNSTIDVDVGILRIAFLGTGGLETDSEASVGDIYLSFFMNSLDALDFDVGVKFSIPDENKNTDGIAIGLGLAFAADDFNLKVRTGVTLGAKSGGGDVDGPTTISLGLLPSFNLGTVTMFIHAGFGILLPDEGDSTMDWFLNPYISMPAGSLRFYAGLQIWQRGITDGAEPPVNFAVPFGFNIYF
jgi:hypothetical protein